jgi:lysophospholipid acyltransferase (LPLAT)-like uncharacterized protein
MLKSFDAGKPGHRLLIDIAAGILQVWFSTCRIKIIGKDIQDRYVCGKVKAVGVTWHRGAIFLVWFFRKIHPMIMFSRSRDGEMMARFAEKLGVIPVRGSSSRGGREAFQGMLSFLEGPSPRKAATVLDGPRGPRFVAKKGMIVLAKKAGVPLIPVMVSACPAITLKKTWDKTMIPFPFSRVTVIYGEPWNIPGELTGEDLESWRLGVESVLNEMMRRADADTGYREVGRDFKTLSHL